MDQHPSSYYVSRFRPQDIRIDPAGLGCVTIDAKAEGPADLGFEIYFPIVDGAVAIEHVELAREVLARIAELDAEARHPWADDPDDGWYLNNVEVENEQVRLNYAAGAFNSELAIAIRRSGDGSWVA